jgi:hypothetical protein
VHRGDGTGSVLTSINNLINLCLSYGSGRSAAKAAMLTCPIFSGQRFHIFFDKLVGVAELATA